MAKTLKQFYVEMQEWIDDGCPEHDVFEPYHGLCVLLEVWSGGDDHLAKMMFISFKNSDLDADFPFNGGSLEDYLAEGDCYKNPERLAWIKKHATEGE